MCSFVAARWVPSLLFAERPVSRAAFCMRCTASVTRACTRGSGSEREVCPFQLRALIFFALELEKLPCVFFFFGFLALESERENRGEGKRNGRICRKMWIERIWGRKEGEGVAKLWISNLFSSSILAMTSKYERKFMCLHSIDAIVLYIRVASESDSDNWRKKSRPSFLLPFGKIFELVVFY